jgi:hypothetical protein
MATGVSSSTVLGHVVGCSRRPEGTTHGKEAQRRFYQTYKPDAHAPKINCCTYQPPSGEAMTSINEMSESEALEYIRAELQILQPILGELISVFWRALVDQWEREGRPGISPVDRQYPLDELSKMATEWLQTRNTLH